MNNEDVYKKDGAKGKIVLFVIGVLVGAVISTAAFLVCVNTLGTNNSGEQSIQMQGGTPPEMPSGQSGSDGQGGTPPEMPSGQNGSSNSNGQSGSSSQNNQNGQSSGSSNSNN